VGEEVRDMMRHGDEMRWGVPAQFPETDGVH